MQSFALLWALNLGAGLLPAAGRAGKPGKWISLVLAVSLGAASVLASRFFFQTQIAALIGYTGLMAGSCLSPFHKKARIPLVLGRSFGVLLVFIPRSAVLLLLLILAGHWISNNSVVALVWSLFLLPFLTAALYKHDVYILLAGLMAIICIVTLIPPLEEATRRKPNSLVKKKLLFFKVTALGLIFVFLGGLFMAKYVYRGFGLQMDILRQGNPEFKLVALTFDDGPNPRYTPAILDILEEFQVPATFFMVGRHVELYPDIARRIVAAGHNIGNHTYSHRSLVPLSGEATRFQILENHRILEEVTGVKPVLFRPPRGVYSGLAREIVKEQGYTMVLWNVTSQDWAETTPRSIAHAVIQNTKSGSIILLHDCGSLITANGGNRDNTVRALPLIIRGLQAQGYTFVSIQDMIIATGLTHVFDDPEGAREGEVIP
jgi:peptidoglycan-N-acetylglucosamine deacetylase